jgi:hypothetical protein
MLFGLYHPVFYSVLFAITFSIWLNLFASRRAGLGDLRLMYDDVPEPAVHGLNLGR